MGRDWRVDTLRGWFLVCMTLAHLPPHPLQPFVGYMFGFASAPDGFVFCSGLVSAWVYLRVRAKKGQKAIENKALRRFRDIYLTHVGLLAMTVLLLSRHSYVHSHPLKVLLAGSLLVYQPHTCDILPMYCMFLLSIPLVLEQFVKGRARWVGMLSLLLWLVSLRGIGDADYFIPYINLGTFNLFTWQAYFVAGMYFGYRGLYGKGPVLPKSRGLLAACFVVSAALFVQRHFPIIHSIPLLEFHLSPDHNPLRFLNAASLGYMIWIAPRGLDAKLVGARCCRFLNYLGKHSLQVFAFSLPVTNVLSYYHAYAWDSYSGASRVLIALLTVATLAIPAKLHEQFRPRQSKPARALEYAPSAAS